MPRRAARGPQSAYGLTLVDRLLGLWILVATRCFSFRDADGGRGAQPAGLQISAGLVHHGIMELARRDTNRTLPTPTSPPHSPPFAFDHLFRAAPGSVCDAATYASKRSLLRSCKNWTRRGTAPLFACCIACSRCARGISGRHALACSLCHVLRRLPLDYICYWRFNARQMGGRSNLCTACAVVATAARTGRHGRKAAPPSAMGGRPRRVSKVASICA